MIVTWSAKKAMSTEPEHEEGDRERLAPHDPVRPGDLRRAGPGGAAGMVVGEWPGRLCCRHGRRNADAALSRAADRSGDAAAPSSSDLHTGRCGGSAGRS